MSHLASGNKTYLLKISGNGEIPDQQNTVFILQDQQTGFSTQFESPEEFAACILQYQNNKQNRVQLSAYPVVNTGTSKLKDRADMLETLLIKSKKRLEGIRFQMTDRISSARTKMGILKMKDYFLNPIAEGVDFEDVYYDLVELSLQIEDWSQICAIVDPKKFGQTEQIAQMVTNLIPANVEADNHY